MTEGSTGSGAFTEAEKHGAEKDLRKEYRTSGLEPSVLHSFGTHRWPTAEEIACLLVRPR